MILPFGTVVQTADNVNSEGEIPQASAFTAAGGEQINQASTVWLFLQNNHDVFLYNVCVWVLLVVVTFIGTTIDDSLFLALPLVFLIFCCLVYVSYSFYYVDDFSGEQWKSTEEAKDIFQNIIETKPRIVQDMRCFHIIKRGSNAIDIVTWENKFDKEFSDWYDVSEELPMFHRKGDEKRPQLQRIYIRKKYDTADNETLDDFELQRQEIIEENRTRDERFTFHETYQVPDAPEMVIVMDNDAQDNLPWYLNQRVYTVAVLLGCGTPFRLLVETCFVDARVWISKKILSKDRLEGVTLESPDVNFSDTPAEDQEVVVSQIDPEVGSATEETLDTEYEPPPIPDTQAEDQESSVSRIDP